MMPRCIWLRWLSCEVGLLFEGAFGVRVWWFGMLGVVGVWVGVGRGNCSSMGGGCSCKDVGQLGDEVGGEAEEGVSVDGWVG